MTYLFLQILFNDSFPERNRRNEFFTGNQSVWFSSIYIGGSDGLAVRSRAK